MTSPESTTLPRNSFRGLPFELRELIYCTVFADLTAELQHPYSDLPLNSRFSTYVSLLLLNKAIGEEVKRVFSERYAEKIVFYFEDACSLIELMRDSETKPSLRGVRFVLRTRTDLQPEPKFNPVVCMNEAFMYKLDWTRGFDKGVGNFIPTSTLDYPENIDLDWYFTSRNRPSPNFEAIVAGDHSLCGKTQEACIPYESIKIPDMKGSLSADLAFWKIPNPDVAQEGDTCSPKTTVYNKHQSMKQVGILLFRGKLCEVFVEGHYRDWGARMHRMYLMAFLVRCPWPKFRALYKGKYPLNAQEWEDFCARKIDYGWFPSLEDLSFAEWSRARNERDMVGLPAVRSPNSISL